MLLRRSLAGVSFLSGFMLLTPGAKAGCAEYKGQIQVCFKQSCEVQRLVRHCSSAVAGNQYISDQGFEFGYSNPIDGRFSTFTVKQYNEVLYEGVDRRSPWSFKVCGDSRHVGGPCSATTWAK